MARRVGGWRGRERHDSCAFGVQADSADWPIGFARTGVVTPARTGRSDTPCAVIHGDVPHVAAPLDSPRGHVFLVSCLPVWGAPVGTLACLLVRRPCPWVS